MIDRAFRICSTDGKEHKRIDLMSKKEYGGDRVVYHRQDLHSVFKAAATAPSSSSFGAEIRVSSRVVSVDCESGSVMLENGDVLGSFDLIIGADGIRSRVRTSVLRKEIEPATTGVAAYRMMIKTSDIEGDSDIARFLDPRDSCTTMVMGHECRLIMGPARNGEVYSIVAMVPNGKYPSMPSPKDCTNAKQSKQTKIRNPRHGQQKEACQAFLKASRRSLIGANGCLSIHRNLASGS